MEVTLVRESSSGLSKTAVYAWLFAFLAYSLDLMDWNFLTFTVSLIAKEFNFSQAQMGLLLGSPLIGAGIGGICSGWLSDKVGRVKAMVLTLCWFSLFTLLFPFGQNYWQLFALRVLAGLGLGAQWGVGGTLVAEMVPTKFRILASSTIQGAAAIGPMVAAFATGLVVPTYGWRPVFFIGAFGFIVALCVWIFIPETELWLKTKEKADKGEIKLADFRRLLEPGILGNLVACSALLILLMWAYYGSMSWIPTWMVTSKGMSIVRSMNYMIILNIGGFLGFLSFGLIADRWGRKPPAYVVLVASVLAMVIFVSIKDPYILLLFAPVYAFMTYPIFGLFAGYMSELFPTDIRGTTVNGIYNVTRLTAFFSPFVIAWMGQKITLTYALGAIAVLYLLGLIPLLTLPETKHRGLI